MSMEKNGIVGFPESNDSGVSLVAYNNAIKELADLFNVQVIDLAKSGITYQNLDTYMGEWDGSTGLHPNSQGHKLMAQKAIKTLSPPTLYSTLF
jgi:lysophospholipase L1-like esterase